MITVLLVDGEPRTARALRTKLTARGYHVLTAQDNQSAVNLATEHDPDVVVIDPGPARAEGAKVVTGLRTRTTAPIVVVSAIDAPAHKVRVLDAGADDYVTKPFNMQELLARLRAVVRRATPQALKDPVITTAAFTIDLGAKKVHRDGVEVHLTPNEWNVVEILVRNSGRLVPQKQLLHDVWGPSRTGETQYLRVYLAQVRRKLEPDPSRPRYFITEPGLGHRFEL
jgi:two-component system KDP operon response regulator KdpE